MSPDKVHSKSEHLVWLCIACSGRVLQQTRRKPNKHQPINGPRTAKPCPSCKVPMQKTVEKIGNTDLACSACVNCHVLCFKLTDLIQNPVSEAENSEEGVAKNWDALMQHFMKW